MGRGHSYRRLSTSPISQHLRLPWIPQIGEEKRRRLEVRERSHDYECISDMCLDESLRITTQDKTNKADCRGLLHNRTLHLMTFDDSLRHDGPWWIVWHSFSYLLHSGIIYEFAWILRQLQVEQIPVGDYCLMTNMRCMLGADVVWPTTCTYAVDAMPCVELHMQARTKTAAGDHDATVTL